MLIALFAGLIGLQQPKPFDFYNKGPYVEGVPKPESILGYRAGERTTNFRDQERVLMAIASGSADRVRMFEYGKTPEGRPLRIFAVSSPENIKRLEQIRKDIGLLADPTPGLNAEPILKRTPVIVWINECIHGNESASFESGMWLLYTLAASKSPLMTKALKDAVVIVNPVYNPDGHERFAVWFNSVGLGSVKPWAYEQDEPVVQSGRLNHYRFDMNRDRVAMSQAESIAESAEFRRWNPQVYADQHGQVSTYFFPPCPMSINVNVGRERYAKWTEVFGRATAKEFDKNGWLYFVKDSFDMYYPGYLDSFASLYGAIGMTHETDGGSNLGYENDDGTIVWLLDGIKKHFTSALAVIESAASHREELLGSFLAFKKDAASGKSAGKFQRVVVSPENPRAVIRLADQLAKFGIKFTWSAKPFTQSAHSYWSDKVEEVKFPVGALVIDMRQPNGPMAKALLSPGADFEAKFTEEQLAFQAKDEFARRYGEGPGFYDMTGWCLIYGHSLKAWWCETAEPVASGDPPQLHSDSKRAGVGAPVGWSLPYRDVQDILAVFDLLRQGVRVSLASRAMHFGGQSTPRGTFLIYRGQNDDGVEKKLASVSSSRIVSFVPFFTSYPDSGKEAPGSESIRSLKKPNIAMVWDPNGFSAFGSAWFLMEREWKLPFTAVPPASLAANLDKYTCVIFPGGRMQINDRLKDWIRGGGCAVVLGTPDALLADGTIVKWETKTVDAKPPTFLPGSLFKATLDARHWLGYGYAPNGEEKAEIAVPIDGSKFYKAPEGVTVGLSADPKAVKLLSGWGWPNNTEKALEGSVWAHVASFGQGNVVVFTQDATERAMWPGLFGMVLNAMLLGAR